MARKFHERRSLANTLLPYLQTRGWNLTEIREGWQNPDAITLPTVSIYFLPTRFEERQLGRDKKAFARRVQIDCYMESENRADAIVDDIMDFIDEITISVTDSNNNSTATMACYNTESIVGDVVPPVLTDPELLRWRGVIKATYETDYIV
jgi:hypothetical protein